MIPASHAHVGWVLLLAAALVLWAGAALGQDTPTVTISPSGSVNITEGGAAVAFTVTVANLPQDATAQYGVLEVKKEEGVTVEKFKLYASDPSMGSPTALSLLDAPSVALSDIYFLQWRAVANIPSTETTYSFWVEVLDDQVPFEDETSINIAFFLFTSTFSKLAGSETLTLNVADAPLPAPTGKPTTPANLKAAGGRGAVTLAWDAVDATSDNTNRLNDLQITKHQYCQKTDTSACGTSDWSDISNSAYGEVNANSYRIGSLTNDTEYTFRVRAVNGCTATTGCGISDASTAVMATPAADARARPTGLAAAAGNTQVTLTWTDPEDTTITFYEYQEKEGLAGFGDWTGDSRQRRDYHELPADRAGQRHGLRLSHPRRQRRRHQPGLGRGHGHAAGGAARRPRAHRHPAPRRRRPELGQPSRPQHPAIRVSVQDRRWRLSAVADRTGGE